MEQTENTLGPFLVNNFGDRYLYGVNRNAFNEIGSDALYRSMFGEQLFNEYQLNVIIGTDSGIFPRFIAKNGVPGGSRFVFIEIPEILELITKEGLLEGLPEEIVVTDAESWQEHAGPMEDYIFLDALHLQGSLASSDAYLPDYRELSWELNLELKSIIHRTLSATNCAQFILRQLENLCENRLGFAGTLVNAFAGRTAIILAGGPSLIDALPWVQENRDRVVVIAASRISRLLQERGITPHIVTTVDPQVISFEVSREMLRFAKGEEAPLLIHSHHASPLLLGQWHGKSVFTSSLFPWRTPLNRDHLAYTGPTVGNYALSIAMHLGCSDIILAGIDLCFSPKGQTHAEGSNENKVGPDLGQFSPRLETYGGWHADTNQGYAEALHILGLQAKLALQRGHRLYNCAKSAAKVDLIDYIDLNHHSVLPAEETPAAVIAARVPESDARSRMSHYRLVKKELSRARRKLQDILNLSQEALECADGLFGTNGKKRDFRHKVRMDKIERRLNGSCGEMTQLIKQFGIKHFLKILKTPKAAEDWTDEQIEKATRDYYETFVDGSTYLIGLVEGAMERLETRMEEEKDQPDFERVSAQWRQDHQCGRIHLWKQAHPGREIPADAAAEAKRLEEEFERTMTEARTSQIELLEKLHDVRHTRSKALILFNRAETGELELMEQGLAEHPDREKSAPYLSFVRGLLAELRGDAEAAVGFYQQLLEKTHPLTEDALLQIASLSLKAQDAESALLALECLSGLSPAYLPPYGDLLKAASRFEDAFNAYNRYVGLVPGDIRGMLKLGMLCSEAGITDAARGLFEGVLERDPNNSAAQRLLADLAA